MRKIFLLFVCFIISGLVFGQSAPVFEDSIKTLLCHKWEYKAILMGGQVMTNFQETVKYDFKEDKTFKRISSNNKKENGNWMLETDGMILLKIKKTKLYIVSLKPDELIVAARDEKDPSKNSLGIATILKRAQE